MRNLQIERILGDWVRKYLPSGLTELIMFFLKQAWASLFGLIFLIVIIITSLIWQDDWALHRYDALFIFAITTQILFLVFKLESLNEAKVILLFHIVGTIMEIFKVKMGSWGYPEPGYIKIADVPLFSGFMYACVGSFMARVIRIFDMRFAPYPPFWMTVALAVAIYANFFTHHYTYDIRNILFVATVVIFWRTRIWFYVGVTPRWMPLPVAAFLSSFFLWIAENVGTMTGTWLYAGQGNLEMVRWAKMGSWYLLLYISFLLVTLVYRDMLTRKPWAPHIKSKG
ncbi:DUF817 domain-containing protein [Amylibacter sp. SFDW26]|uniref:DUF817 domain-containing protein n=1 Tax=Amylibacter sp. SFDW26 TaxID=2652722 RepID=UPI001D008EF2|nr:DUF817 domain-containing protein [Amylibacter sp. SFDW26]